MKFLICVGVLLSQALLYGQQPRMLELTNAHEAQNFLRIAEVTLEKVVLVSGRADHHLGDKVKVTFGINTDSTHCTKPASFKYLFFQSSFDSHFYGSDQYIKLAGYTKPNCVEGGAAVMGKGNTQVSFESEFVVNNSLTNVTYLSFLKRLRAGRLVWGHYKLDYSNPRAVQLEELGEYSFVQGKITHP